MHSKRLVLAAATLAAALVAGTATGAVHAKKPSPVKLSGTWLTTVALDHAPPGVAPSFRALDTFLPSGELLVSSSQGMPADRGLAHGAWVRTGARSFASTFVWFRFDPTGAPLGMQRVRRTLELDASRASFEASDVVELLDPDGNVVATLHATETGTRLAAR